MEESLSRWQPQNAFASLGANCRLAHWPRPPAPLSAGQLAGGAPSARSYRDAVLLVLHQCKKDLKIAVFLIRRDFWYGPSLAHILLLHSGHALASSVLMPTEGNIQELVLARRSITMAYRKIVG